VFALFLTLIFFFCSLDAQDAVLIHKRPNQMESVRIEQTLCMSEQLAKKNRQPRVKKGLEQFLGHGSKRAKIR
jgi:hypothetical protein